MLNSELREFQQKYHKELFENALPFWMNNAPDSSYGGVFTCLDRTGDVYSTDKSVWAQGRTAWLFSHLYRNYPRHPQRAQWLTIAKSCLDFVRQHCIDPEDKRMYFTVTRTGEPLRKRRYFFSETFYIIGCAEYAAAAGDPYMLETAKMYYDFVWEMYRNPNADPYKITPKGIEKTRQTIALANPMILLNVTSVMRRCDPGQAARYDVRAKELVADITGKFMKPELGALLESVGTDGTFHDWYSAGRVVNPGHSLEAGWFLMEQAGYLSDPSLFDTAAQIFDWSIELGWDREYDGLFYFVDILGKPPEQYEHDMKLWWPHCEGIIAALYLYRHTKEGKYARWFRTLTDYSFRVFSDAPNDWFGYLRRNGEPTQPACKGSTYKSAFHVARMLSLVDLTLTDMLREDEKSIAFGEGHE